MWVALQSAWASLRTRPLSSDISRIDEESFILLEGEIEATLRGVKSAVKEGQHRPHPGQRASSVSQHEQPTRPTTMHLLSCRAGRVLRRGWRPGRDPDDSHSEAGRGSSSGSLERRLKRCPGSIGQRYCGMHKLI